MTLTFKELVATVIERLKGFLVLGAFALILIQLFIWAPVLGIAALIFLIALYWTK